MERMHKLLRRFLLSLFAAMLALLAANVLLYAAYVHTAVHAALRPSVEDTCRAVSQALTQEQGRFSLAQDAAEQLSEQGIWAMLLLPVETSCPGVPASGRRKSAFSS